MCCWVYIRTENQLWTVGFYSPDGKFNPESDHDNREEAAKRVAWLNGGRKLVRALKHNRTLAVDRLRDVARGSVAKDQVGGNQAMRITRHGQLLMKDERRGYLPAAKVFWWPGIVESETAAASDIWREN